MTILPSLTNNFLDLWQQLIDGHAPGWEIYQIDRITCLKSPIPSPRFNFAWGFKSNQDLENAYTFFKGKSFAYLGESSDPFNTEIPHDFKIPVIEMFLKREDFKSTQTLSSIEIKEVKTSKEAEAWAKIAQEAENLNYEHMLELVTTFQEYTPEKFLLASKEDCPVAVAEVNLSSQGVGLISSVGVLEKERKQGIGTAIMERSIKTIFNEDGKYAALFSYAHAEEFYKKMGFVPVRNWELLIVKAR